ncbi:MAG: hypothetical protein A3J28_11355 [Acidobacteria bacterium RIFCSPLOWO2_12_FULL_60_22]|nr:MAG: hypothetical protein A3J28_11355 [Acidobacteria bacterium RIFCSPLOWO2_12_FULL_60_22]
MHWVKCVWIFALVIAIANSPLQAQTAGGSISGVVRDESGAVIPGANITVSNVDTGIARSTVTDAGGRYQVPGLIPGHYEVQAEKEGFRTEVRAGLQLTVGAEIAIPLVLRVGQVAQVTVVTGEAPMIETTTSTLSGLVDDRTIRDLPLNGRSFDQLISLESAAPTFRLHGANSAAGYSNVYTINGARTKSNLYVMDGLELVGANASSTMPGGVLGTNMGVDAVQEFQVLTGSYSAVYGKKAGGIINIATRSGTNQIHGSAVEFLRNDNLDARNFFDPKAQPPEFRRNQFGGAVGGPIWRDRTFYFGSYEGLREGLGLTSISLVPDDNARRGFLPDPATGGLRNVGVAPNVQPFFAVFPVANGRNFGDGTAEFHNAPTEISSQDFFMIRGDHKFSDQDFFFARYNFTRARQFSPGGNPYFATTVISRDQSALVEYKKVSATTLNSLRLGFTRGQTHDIAAATIDLAPSLFFFPGAVTMGQISFGGGTGSSSATLSGAGVGSSYGRYWAVNVFDISDQVSLHRGPHALQIGAQVQRIQHNEDRGSTKMGSFTFDDLPAFLAGRAREFQAPDPVGGNNAAKSYRQTYFAAYLQDDFKLRPNFTLNLGVRYEFMTPPTEPYGRLSNYRPFVDERGLRVLETQPHLGTPFIAGTYNIFAPRVGIAWDVFGNGQTAIRSGFGMFYDQIESEYRTSTNSNGPFFNLLRLNNPPFPLGFSGTALGTARPIVDGIEFDVKVPTRMQWSFSIQQQITPSTVFNVGYVGAHSYHFIRFLDGNPAVHQLLPGGVKFFPAVAPRRNPALGATRNTTSDANGNYNALQLGFNQRMTSGLRYKVSFTWAKNMDDASTLDSADTNGTIYASQDPDNTKLERGLSAYDIRRNLVMNFTYDFPWNNFSGVAGKLLGGWQLGTIATISDGSPFTAVTGFRRARDQSRTVADRPNLAPGASNNPVLGGPDKYFERTSFTLPPVGFYGNIGRNTLIAPGFANLDFTLSKRTALNERMSLDFRAEFFNLLNRANFGLPDKTIFVSNGSYRGAAGRISNTVSTSRQIQFGVKLSF